MITDLLKLKRPLIWTDVETHDVGPPEQLHICDISFIVLYPAELQKEPKVWGSLVKPPKPITAAATEAHHITNEEVANAPTWDQLGANIAKGFTDCDFGGYNIRFDMRVIYSEMLRIGVKWSFETAKLVDALRIWHIGAPRTLSDAVREFCKREPTEAHRAAGDTRDAMEVAFAMLQRFEHLPRDIDSLHQLSFADKNKLDPDGKIIWIGSEAGLSFGKHNGVVLKNIPRGYLEWIMGGGFAPEVKKIVGDALLGIYPSKVSLPEKPKDA